MQKIQGPMQKFTWCLWDAGGAAVNAVATTFVFSVYLTSSAFGNQTTSSQAISTGMTVVGLVVALTVPITGQRADRRGKGTFWLGVLSVAMVGCMALMFFIKPAPEFLWPGVVLLAVLTMFFEFATVNYYAMLPRISDASNVGRISGIGWAFGYFGGIILLLFLNYGFISENNFTGLDTSEGRGVRVAMVVAAIWALLFFVPVLFGVRGRVVEGCENLGRESILTSYRKLWKTIVGLYRKAPNVLYFLLASAVFRDGLAGVFTYGGMIAAVTFGFSPGEVILFAVAANVIAGISTTIFGFFDDSIGPKKVMLLSLVMLVLCCAVVFLLHDGGKIVMWTAGLLMTVWVGPAQSASRSFLARRIPKGHEGEVFGLYQTTGRAVTWMAPLAFTLFISLGQELTRYYPPAITAVTAGPGAGLIPVHEQAQYWGILGVALVLFVGLLLLLPVKDQKVTLETEIFSHTSRCEGAGVAQVTPPAEPRPGNTLTTNRNARRALDPSTKPRPGKIFAALVVALAAGLVLAGCSQPQTATQPAAPGSPDLEVAGALLASVPLDGAELQVLNEDQTVQLRQQVEKTGGNFADAQVEPQRCHAVMGRSFELPNLRWTSLAAASADQKVAAHLYLAPEAAQVRQELSQLAALFAGCTDLEVQYKGTQTRAKFELLDSTGQSVTFREKLSRGQDFTDNTVHYAASGNALLALVIPSEGIDDPAPKLVDYAKAFFAKLKPLYDDPGEAGSVAGTGGAASTGGAVGTGGEDLGGVGRVKAGA